jgi:hypothetical protein
MRCMAALLLGNLVGPQVACFACALSALTTIWRVLG